MNNRGLYQCTKKKHLSRILSNPQKNIIISQRELRNVPFYFDKDDMVFYESKTTKERFSSKPANYSPKKFRKFISPSFKRKTVLRKMNFYLQKLETPDYLYSVTERDYVKNARKHLGNSNYILMDISNFFPNCNYMKVHEWLLSKSGLSVENDIAKAILNLVTCPSKNNKREIPQGYPTSTLICYFSYKKMFDEIYGFSNKYGVTFTTYVDDLTFSYNDSTVLDIPRFCDKVKSIVESYGHKINNDKLKIYQCLTPSENPKMQPIITGVYLKRYKIRASFKMHSKMVMTFNKVKSIKIVDVETYFKAWQYYLKLEGITNTINLIEPLKTRAKRDYIINYIENNKKHFPRATNIKKVKKLRLEDEVYKAYVCGNIDGFLKMNHSKLFG